jgi:hypothetical protein
MSLASQLPDDDLLNIGAMEESEAAVYRAAAVGRSARVSTGTAASAAASTTAASTAASVATPVTAAATVPSVVQPKRAGPYAGHGGGGFGGGAGFGGGFEGLLAAQRAAGGFGQQGGFGAQEGVTQVPNDTPQPPQPANVNPAAANTRSDAPGYGPAQPVLRGNLTQLYRPPYIIGDRYDDITLAGVTTMPMIEIARRQEWIETDRNKLAAPWKNPNIDYNAVFNAMRGQADRIEFLTRNRVLNFLMFEDRFRGPRFVLSSCIYCFSTATSGHRVEGPGVHPEVDSAPHEPGRGRRVQPLQAVQGLSRVEHDGVRRRDAQ